MAVSQISESEKIGLKIRLITSCYEKYLETGEWSYVEKVDWIIGWK